MHALLIRVAYSYTWGFLMASLPVARLPAYLRSVWAWICPESGESASHGPFVRISAAL